jgi:peptidoglycan-N-acetylglucosamine deacetylase
MVATAFEIIYDIIEHGTAKSFGLTVLFSLIKDLFFLMGIALILFIPFLGLYLLSKNAARVFFLIVAILMLLIQLSLSKYFVTTLVPLGADLWGYSWIDIKTTVGAAGALGIGSVLLFIIWIAAIYFTFKYLKPKIRITDPIAILTFIGCLIILIFTSAALNEKWLPGQDEHSNNLSLNKSWYFYKHSQKEFFPDNDEQSIYSDNYFGDVPVMASSGDSVITINSTTLDNNTPDTSTTASTVNNTNPTSTTSTASTPVPVAPQPNTPPRFVDQVNYPFLHTIGNRDVLSPFFNKGDRAPNIVIILVEGLGRAFTNHGAYLGNFTPFLDSLSQHSLYWENFLSEGGRTFAVLPSFMGSLPFGKNGFNEMGDNMPKHLSLLSLLKFNGYSTHWYYGGDGKFDNLNLYMRKNEISSINDLNNFPAGYSKMPASSAGFSWGYGDKELFRRYLNTKPVSPTPSVNVLLTLSTHSPFLVNDQDYYLQKVEQRMGQLAFDDSRKSEARNYKYQYASIMYMDDAVRYFINEYKKRADFNNTVFIITGDHRMPEIPMSTKIDRYHVPLIIYSPLLKRSATFQSVSTHFDVTPTLLMWLKNSYGIKLPDMINWIGDGIDINPSFRNVHSYPLMQTKSTLIDFIMGEYMLNDNTLFKISSSMGLDPVQDEAKAKQLEGSFNNFKRKNDRFIQGAKLVPDTLLQKYFPK